MYIAYYVMRCDGDADLYAVVENCESVCEDLAIAFLMLLNKNLKKLWKNGLKLTILNVIFPMCGI